MSIFDILNTNVQHLLLDFKNVHFYLFKEDRYTHTRAHTHTQGESQIGGKTEKKRDL